MPKVLIFIEKGKLAPTGGPSAVCYYYLQELQKRGESKFYFLDDMNSNSTLHVKEAQMNSKHPKWIMKTYYFIKEIIKTNKLLGGNYPIVPFTKYNQYDIIHFHDTRTMYLRRHELKNYTGKVVLQSHSPQPLGHELYNVIPASVRFFVPFIRGRFEEMDKYAFERADYIVFPCEDAEEPYFNDWPYYKLIHKAKKENYRYILTGIPSCSPKRNKEEVRTELSIPISDFVVIYVGRHNEVKGYDSLKRMGSSFLGKTQNNWVICAGKEAPLTRLNHPRWIEVGWTKDAHSYISASDVFVLPNKETYFDIVMLEVLSLGKIVIASRTGGNKYFEKMGCEGVLLYDTEDEAVELLNKVKQMTKEERILLGQKNKIFYEKYHTVASMYDSYIAMLEDISKSL